MLRTSLGKEVSHPVSQPHHPAFILGIVPCRCSRVCHPFPCTARVAWGWPWQAWRGGRLGAKAPKVRLSRCHLWTHIASFHLHSHPFNTGGISILTSKMRKLRHRRAPYLAKGSQPGRQRGDELSVQAGLPGWASGARRAPSARSSPRVLTSVGSLRTGLTSI